MWRGGRSPDLLFTWAFFTLIITAIVTVSFYSAYEFFVWIVYLIFAEDIKEAVDEYGTDQEKGSNMPVIQLMIDKYVAYVVAFWEFDFDAIM